MRRFLPLFAALLVACAAPAMAASPSPAFRMEILVDGRPVPQYPARGTVYVEALKGKDTRSGSTTRSSVRVAVALSVDGLNTIDARRTSAADARKWVLDPHETITISGWQTDMSHARKFYFTTEQDSYAQWLGKIENIGVITRRVLPRARGLEDRPDRHRLPLSGRTGARRRERRPTRSGPGPGTGAARRAAGEYRPPVLATAPATRSAASTWTSRISRPRRSACATNFEPSSCDLACCRRRRRCRKR